MTISLPSAVWCDLWQESREQSQLADSEDLSDRIATCPTLLGRGYKRNISLRNGIELTLHHYQLSEDLVSPETQPEHQDCLEWVFNLSSTFQFEDGPTITNGQHYVHGLFSSSPNRELARDERVAVHIHLEPDKFRALIGDRLEILPPALHRMLEGDELMPLSSVRSITPTMQLALQQVLNCPYQGVMKQMYLESKSVEVLVLWLEQAMTDGTKAVTVKFSEDDTDRIHQARDILIQRAVCPPSLIELAHQTGLNDRKLKQGFQAVFGTTVFGYLYEYRMQQAAQLLLNNQVSVNQIAQQIGYASRGAFYKAFKKKFGISPRNYVS